jgi:PmbA protein
MNYQEFFKSAEKKNIKKIQITEKTTIQSDVEITNGKIISYNDYNQVKYNIKAEYNKKTVKVCTEYLSDEILDLIITKALSTDSEYNDDYLINKEIIKKEKELDFDIATEVRKLKELDNIRNNYNDLSKLTTYFSENFTNTRIINNSAVDISTNSHLCTFVVEAIVEKDNDTTNFDSKVIEVDKSAIDFKKVTEETINKAIILSNKSKVETKKYNVILDSSVSSKIISHLGNMLSATNIRNKVSCMENNLDCKIFSDKLTIIEEPTNKKFPGYRLFDDEGTLTYKKTVVEEGKLKTQFYDIKEALLINSKSTGNGYQSISTRNMYVVPGKNNDQELIKKLNNGIYITDYMGASGTSINTVNGNISLQIFGFIVKNGEIISGIEPAIMTTTIFELLSNIDEISKDLKFTMTSTASPSLLIKDISIAG